MIRPVNLRGMCANLGQDNNFLPWQVELFDGLPENDFGHAVGVNLD